MAPEPIARLLGGSAELRLIADRLQHIKRLQKRYRTLIPDSFAEASRVCAIDGTTVVICAASGPVAAALRHLAPRILEGLRGARKPPKSSWDQELISIRIEVQVERAEPRRPVKPRGEMPRAKLDVVADALADSPLKETLKRLAREQDQSIKRTRSKT